MFDVTDLHNHRHRPDYPVHALVSLLRRLTMGRRDGRALIDRPHSLSLSSHGGALQV